MNKLIIALAFCLTFTSSYARIGGGRSFGSRGSRMTAPRSYPSSPMRSNASPYASQRAEAPGAGPYNSPQSMATPGLAGGGFMRGLAGGLAGGLIGSMLFRNNQGFAGESGIGGGAGGGGGFGFIEIFIVRWMKQRNATQFATSSPQGYGESYNNYSSPSAPLPQTEEEITSVLGQRDPNFQLAPFKEARTDDFFKLQAALMGRDLGTVRDKVTPEILSVLESDIATLKTAGKINRIENIAVRETEIVEAWEESDRQYATLRLKASLLDYTVDDKMGTLLSGSTTDPIKFDEHWTFVKEVNAPHWKLTAIENNI